MTDSSTMPESLAREILRLAEARLAGTVTLATAADMRATTLCGIFGAAGVGMGAAVLAATLTAVTAFL